MKSFLKYLLFVLILALAVALLYVQKLRQNGSASTNWKPEKFTPATEARLDLKDMEVLAKLDSEYKKLSNAVVPSVVSILTSKRVETREVDPFELFFGQRRSRGRTQVQTALGSGFIVSKEGHIVTNNHVIEGMDEIKVQLSDGRIAPATALGADPQTDLAVLKINLPNVQPLPIGDSEQVEVGQLVFAIGNPYGLQESVSQGIISAKGRRGVSDSQVEFLQTDAAVNRGNSGGPLVNIRGEVIGVNSVIFSESGGSQGIAFAIPASTVKNVVESIIQRGKIVRGYLGVTMNRITPEQATQLGSDAQGVIVEDVVESSPADKAGVQPGDLIRSLNGKKIEDPLALRNGVSQVAIGGKVELGILRDEKELKLTAIIAEQPENYLSNVPRALSPANPNVPPATPQALGGINVEDITRDAASEYNLPGDLTGVLVTGVDDNSTAAGKLAPGDVIQEINRNAVRSVDEYRAIVSTLDPQARQVLFIVRGPQKSFVVINPA